MVTRAPAGAASSRSRRLEANTRTASCLRRGPQPHPQIDVEMHLDLGAPGPAHGVDQPAVAGTAVIADAAKRCMICSSIRAERAGVAAGRRDRLGQDLQIEDLFLLAAEHRQDAMRRQLGQRLAEIEIIGELLALGLLAVAHASRSSRRSTTSARATRRSGRRLRRSARPESRARRRAPPRHRRPACRHRRRPRPRPADRSAARSAADRPAAPAPLRCAISALVRRFGLYGR